MKRYLPIAPMAILTLSTLMCAEGIAGEKNSSDGPVKGKIRDKSKTLNSPLSEAFLLFLAEMEQSDGELIHPIDFDAQENKERKMTAPKNEQIKPEQLKQKNSDDPNEQ